MTKTTTKQSGFTLVELAIVMIIIGLLIGGILKGQELISNARVAATVSQIKAIDAAVNTFFEAYDALPGDIQNPQTRIPNCAAAPCNQTGNGNGQIGTEPGAGAAITTENITAWANLSAADVLGGIRPNAAALNPGEAFPVAEVPGSSIVMGYSAGTLTLSNVPAASIRAGHYILISNARSAALAAAGVSMTPSVAFRIDSKMDDGRPNTGSVIGAGAGAGTVAGNCKDTATVAGVYNEALPSTECAIYARIGG